MEVSKLELSTQLSNQKLNRTDKRRIRLEKVKEKYGDSFVTSKEFLEAAGYEMEDREQYKKGMGFLSNLNKAGIVSSIPSGELNSYGKATSLYRLKYIPEGRITKEAKSTIKKFTKDDLKKISKVEEPRTVSTDNNITVEIEKMGTIIRFKASASYLKEIKELVNEFIGF